MLRRDLLKLFAAGSALLSGLIKPLTALAKWNQAAFDATDFDSAINHTVKSTCGQFMVI